MCIFGEIIDGEMILSESGKIAATEWERSQEIRREIELGEWVVMPNHLHGIVIITKPTVSPSPSSQESEGGRRGVRLYAQDGTNPPEDRKMGSRPKSLSSMMQGYKSATTTRINSARQTPGEAVWQRNYFERIIRNQRELDAIQTYILDNPRRWAEDKENPDRQR